MENEADVGIIVTTAEKPSEEAQKFIDSVNEEGRYSLGFIGGIELCRELISTGVFPEFDLK
jgi:hypothetical protein